MRNSTRPSFRRRGREFANNGRRQSKIDDIRCVEMRNLLAVAPEPVSRAEHRRALDDSLDATERGDSSLLEVTGHFNRLPLVSGASRRIRVQARVFAELVARRPGSPIIAWLDCEGGVRHAAAVLFGERASTDPFVGHRLPRRGSTGTGRTRRRRRSSGRPLRTRRGCVSCAARPTDRIETANVSRAVRSHFPASCRANARPWVPRPYPLGGRLDRTLRTTHMPALARWTLASSRGHGRGKVYPCRSISTRVQVCRRPRETRRQSALFSFSVRVVRLRTRRLRRRLPPQAPPRSRQPRRCRRPRRSRQTATRCRPALSCSVRAWARSWRSTPTATS